MNALKREKYQNSYVYPTAVLCVDTALGDDIIKRAEHILKHDGYIVIKVVNFKHSTANENISDMYNSMDMQSIRNADVVIGVTISNDNKFEDSIAEALQYAKDNYVTTDTMHFV